MTLFNAIGEPNVTTSAISDEMGISPGNLYYHFRNKEEIVNALFEQYEREIDALLEAAPTGRIAFDDAWIFLHLMFELIWKFRFVYRDINDLLSRHRRIEVHFRSILERKRRAAGSVCESLAATGGLVADPREIESLATNMVMIATYWLSFEYASNARRFDDPAYQSDAIARGAYQVLSLVIPYLSGQGRELMRELAHEYLEPRHVHP